MAYTRRPRLRLMFIVFGLLAFGLLTPSTALGQDAPPPADTVPPVVVQPQNILVAAVDATGVVVAYPVPTASDETSGVVPVDCVPAVGALFPLGQTPVACTAQDAAGNLAVVNFTITVVDQTPPVIAVPADVVADAVDAAGAAVSYAVPAATDNVDGPVAVGCDMAPGAFFPVGTTVVTCYARDAAGLPAAPVAFRVTVNPPPLPPPAADPPPAAVEPTPTEEPIATDVPAAAEEPEAAATANPTKAPAVIAVEEPGTATEPPAATETPLPSATPSARAASPTPTATVPAALTLPWPPPPNFVLVTDGGPIDGLAAIWGNLDFPISQEYGHTAFSIAHHAWYAYGLDYGLDGYEHPGLDVNMPAGTPLYSPVDGTVVVAGGVPFFTFYGNGQPGVGELLIETDTGHEVILGHMGLITVHEGQRVEAGQFVGLSGGDNGDHLHLETRERQWWGGYRIVDPRDSFLIPELQETARRNDPDAAAETPPDVDRGTVAKVVDAYTNIVRFREGFESVHLVGVDSLDTTTPDDPGAYGVPEASGYLPQLLTQRREIWLERDVRDCDDRLPRYVWTRSGADDTPTVINERLIQLGYAVVGADPSGGAEHAKRFDAAGQPARDVLATCGGADEPVASTAFEQLPRADAGQATSSVLVDCGNCGNDDAHWSRTLSLGQSNPYRFTGEQVDATCGANA